MAALARLAAMREVWLQRSCATSGQSPMSSAPPISAFQGMKAASCSRPPTLAEVQARNSSSRVILDWPLKQKDGAPGWHPRQHVSKPGDRPISICRSVVQNANRGALARVRFASNAAARAQQFAERLGTTCRASLLLGLGCRKHIHLQSHGFA
jgi:hypothetical protein